MEASQLSQILTQIRDTLLQAGLNQNQIAIKIDRIEKAEEEKRILAYKWLIALRDVYVRNFQKAYTAVPESVWIIYKNSGVQGQHEQVQLEQHRKILLKQWTERPLILRRDTGGKRRKSRAISSTNN